jgi:hypothetical protein
VTHHDSAARPDPSLPVSNRPARGVEAGLERRAASITRPPEQRVDGAPLVDETARGEKVAVTSRGRKRRAAASFIAGAPTRQTGGF